VRDAQGTVVASAPKAEVGLSGRALFSGRLVAESINLVGAELSIRIEKDGRVTVFAGADKRPIAAAPAPVAPVAEAPLPGGASGALGALAGAARTTLDVHYDGPGALSRGGPNAFLLGGESHVTLSNQRGTVQIVLRRGDCASPGLAFDGDSATLASPTGTWASTNGGVVGTGAYRSATGSGTYGFASELHPGADNTWSVVLNGNLDVLQPALKAKVERTYWGNLGLDYLSRVVTVVYRVGNTGAGDSFGAQLTKATSPSSGVKPCAEPPSTTNTCPNGGAPGQSLGDLLSCGDATLPATCDSELVTVRYQLALVGGPCALVLLGCQFQATLETSMPDALDVASAKSVTLTVRAPDLPPPL